MLLDLIRKKTQTILIFVLLFMAVALILSLIQPLKYESKSKILVIQSFPEGTDPYAASRSNKYLSMVLAEVVKSDSFYNEVLNSGFEIDGSYFKKTGLLGGNEFKAWEETIAARSVDDTGTIEIFTYHTDKNQAVQIARAVNYIFKTRNQNYHGAGDKVSIKTINDPQVSSFPVKPNIAVNLGLALFFGLVFSLAYIYLYPDESYDLRIIPGKRRHYGPASYGEYRYAPAARHRAFYSDENPARFEEDMKEFNRQQADRFREFNLYEKKDFGTYSSREPGSGKYDQQKNDNVNEQSNYEIYQRPKAGQYQANEHFFDDKGNKITFKGNIRNVIG